ncbi:hypothetical protein SARC_04696 [Sphaeroforma arctica JP610]|uniref:Uncharacterized protein n=1 Tax=Sphaeroforma arctica JP610 TaxID=667725 RepID=A0A0L0G1Q6_9EUKA|nr:hypothetical protein SARC_04696 [Sphaeroforma arctica JP610]KNC83025.1 hypothetical protein SARC_04696 [Sphaeroforma arctica JP610]|eukprot:XP_014156927.1 hypothetical protein SARC_04696 [Sphaeroforma arctica JP610]
MSFHRSDLEQPPVRPDRRSLTPPPADDNEGGAESVFTYVHTPTYTCGGSRDSLGRTLKFESMPDVFPEGVHSRDGQWLCVDPNANEIAERAPQVYDQQQANRDGRESERKGALHTGAEKMMSVHATSGPGDKQASYHNHTTRTHTQSNEGTGMTKRAENPKDKIIAGNKRPWVPIKTRSLRDTSGVINNLIQTLTTNFGSLKAPVPASHFHCEYFGCLSVTL